MSAAVLDRPVARTAARTAPVRTRDGGPTLEGVIVSAWEGLSSHRGVGCPLCGGHMTPRYGASGLEPVGGRCGDCGTTLG
jgi:hypothetical protein